MPRIEPIALVITPDSAPQYELRVCIHGPGDSEYAIWQLPAPATPQVNSATRIAGLRGRNLDLVEHRVLKHLKQIGIKWDSGTKIKKRNYRLTEDLALVLGLLFRTLAPMQNRDRLREVAGGIEAMGHEEASYWIGMAMHRKNPRRVLMALRILLTMPQTRHPVS